jgi:WD40 repeat protein
MLLAVGGANTVRLWDVKEGDELDEKTLEGDILNVTFSADGQLVAAASSRGRVYTWHVATGAGKDYRVGESTHGGSLNAVAVSPDQKWTAVGRSDARIMVWSEDGRLPVSELAVPSPVYGLDFSPDGKTLVSVDGGGVARAWALNEKDEWVARLSWPFEEPLRTVDFSGDGKTIAVAGDEGVIYLVGFDVPRRSITAYEGPVPVPVFKVEFSRDGKYLISASNDNAVRVWDVVFSDKLLARIVETSNDPNFLKEAKQSPAAMGALPGEMPGETRQRLLTDVSLSPDGKYVAAARADNRPVHVYAWSYFRDSAELLKEAEKYLSR